MAPRRRRAPRLAVRATAKALTEGSVEGTPSGRVQLGAPGAAWFGSPGSPSCTRRWTRLHNTTISRHRQRLCRGPGLAVGVANRWQPHPHSV